MSDIRYLETYKVFDNPLPHLRSRHGYFPRLAQLASGDLLAMVVIGEAFESVDLTTHVFRSTDLGRTWRCEGPLYDKSREEIPTSNFMKPTVLRDGSLMAVGYRFLRRNPDEPIGIAATGGLQPGEDIVAFSEDEGHTWTVPEVIPNVCPGFAEIPGPCIETRSGDLLVFGAPMPTPEGTFPAGQYGVLLRSKDNGRSWKNESPYFDTPQKNINPYESGACEMQDGRIVVIVWAYDHPAGKNYTNHVVVSHDNGCTWSKPIDVGTVAESSNIMWLEDDLLLAIQCQRTGDIGLFVRVVNFANDEWRVLGETKIWGGVRAHATDSFAHQCATMKFGQPSLLRVNGDILATHWCVEDGQGKVLSHRLALA
jgi:sialidase-1